MTLGLGMGVGQKDGAREAWLAPTVATSLLAPRVVKNLLTFALASVTVALTTRLADPFLWFSLSSGEGLHWALKRQRSQTSGILKYGESTTCIGHALSADSQASQRSAGEMTAPSSRPQQWQ
ncbi:hypothetical protein F4780DRAFT_776688 [Xylariomycetidae sp. FL0641]|nr:hypothetical protein F4780DRAFT_776688 [Xylariomycetidae sp. FL0641]